MIREVWLLLFAIIFTGLGLHSWIYDHMWGHELVAGGLLLIAAYFFIEGQILRYLRIKKEVSTINIHIP